MEEKDNGEKKYIFSVYSKGYIALVIIWFSIAQKHRDTCYYSNFKKSLSH